MLIDGLCQALPLEGDPIDGHLPHVVAAQIAGRLGLEADHPRYFFATVFPTQSAKPSPGVGCVLGVLHHLPEAFHAAVLPAPKDKQRIREVGQ